MKSPRRIAARREHTAIWGVASPQIIVTFRRIPEWKYRAVMQTSRSFWLRRLGLTVAEYLAGLYVLGYYAGNEHLTPDAKVIVLSFVAVELSSRAGWNLRRSETGIAV
jgi:hypothetical protein